MCEAIQHPGARRKLLNCAAIQLLIQKEACFLSLCDIHEIANAVFPNFDFRVKGRREEALSPLHPLFEPLLRVAPLKDAAYRQTFTGEHFEQEPKHGLLHSVHAECQTLEHQDIAEFIDRESRQKIRLPENQAAGRGVNDLLPETHGVQKALP